MAKFGYILNEDVITLQFSDGKVEILPTEKSGALIKALNDKLPEEQIRLLADRAKAVESYMDGKVEVRNGNVLYGGMRVENVVTRKIVAFMDKGWPCGALIAFLERLMKNPSNRAVNELYKFLEDGSLGITDAGTFQAYKAIRPDWTDIHSGTYDNHVGQTLEMPRNSVDDDCRRGCSCGFHVGTLTYVRGFKGTQDRIVIVEVDPADVVSVPVEDCGKVRVCKYKVVGEYTGLLPAYVPPADAPVPADNQDDDPDDDPDGSLAEIEVDDTPSDSEV